MPQPDPAWLDTDNLLRQVHETKVKARWALEEGRQAVIDLRQGLRRLHTTIDQTRQFKSKLRLKTVLP
jgi:hypothetical protein